MLVQIARGHGAVGDWRECVAACGLDRLRISLVCGLSDVQSLLCVFARITASVADMYL